MFADSRAGCADLRKLSRLLPMLEYKLIAISYLGTVAEVSLAVVSGE